MWKFSVYNRILPTLLTVSFILQVGSVPHFLKLKPANRHTEKWKADASELHLDTDRVKAGHTSLEPEPHRSHHEEHEGEPDHIDPEPPKAGERLAAALSAYRIINTNHPQTQTAQSGTAQNLFSEITK